MRKTEEEVANAEARMQEMEMDHKAAAEETGRQIRFLEKENLELMMEIKRLKEHIIKVCTLIHIMPCTQTLQGSSD